MRRKLLIPLIFSIAPLLLLPHTKETVLSCALLAVASLALYRSRTFILQWALLIGWASLLHMHTNFLKASLLSVLLPIVAGAIIASMWRSWKISKWATTALSGHLCLFAYTSRLTLLEVLNHV